MTRPAAPEHKWDRAGECCLLCGAKDWMNSTCTGKPTPEVDAEVEDILDGREDTLVAWHGAWNRIMEFSRSLERRLSLALTEIKGHMRIAKEAAERAEKSDRRCNVMSACYDADLAEAQARIAALEKDAARVDWVERYLCRAGEVKDDAGQTVKLCRVWSIMGELETFRETVDAHIAALKSRA